MVPYAHKQRLKSKSFENGNNKPKIKVPTNFIEFFFLDFHRFRMEKKCNVTTAQRFTSNSKMTISGHRTQ